MSTWLNGDGLYIRYGQTEVTTTDAGQYATPVEGGSHVVEVRIPDLTTLSTSAETIVGEGVFVPKGYVLEEVHVISDTAATSGGLATLDIGFIRASDRSTEVDYDGAVAALALESINAAGEKNVIRVGSTGAGALVGNVVSADHVTHVTAGAGTAVFTAGALTIRLVLRKV